MRRARGIACFVLIPEGKIALGKLSQAMMHGSVVIQIRGNFDDGMRLVQLAAESTGVALVNSINPYRPQGQKTVAFEVRRSARRRARLPRAAGRQRGQHRRALDGLQRSGVRGDAGLRVLRRQVPFPPREDRDAPADHAGLPGLGRGAHRARQARRESRDRRDRDPHRQPGVVGARGRRRSANPAAGSPSAPTKRSCACRSCSRRPKGSSASRPRRSRSPGVLKDLEPGRIGEGSTIVCTLTGHGLKDPDTAIAQCVKPQTVDAELAEIERVIRERLPKN